MSETEITREQLMNHLSNLSVMEVSKLVKDLEEEWGVSAAPQMVAGPQVSPEESAPVEKVEFDVVLVGFDEPKKMAVIKEIRTISGLPLKESKTKVEESASTPFILQEAIDKDQAEETQRKLEEIGAKIELK